MGQPIRNCKNKKIVAIRNNTKKRIRPKYGTSKLEEKFAKDFLEVIGLPYERQFEAVDIKRFYDFKVGNVLIEIDGDYW